MVDTVTFLKNLCATCLSYQRKMQSISSCDPFKKLCATLWKDIELSDNAFICWECRSTMNKLQLFRTRALQAQSLLSQFGSKEGYISVKSLSNYIAVCAYSVSIDAFDQAEDICDVNNFIDVEPRDIPIFPSTSILNENEFDDTSVKEETAIGDDYMSPDHEPLEFETYENQDLDKPPIKKRLKSKNIGITYDLKYLTEQEMSRYRQKKRNSSQYKRAKFKCDNCMKTFSSNSSYNKHFQQHQIVGDFTCNICQLSFIDKKLLSKHITSHYVLYKCKMCKFSGDVSSVTIHYSRRHKTKYCKICGESFKTREQYKKHSVLHSKKRTCESCGVKFSNEKFLKLHKHDNEGEAYFECDICQKQFKKKERIWEHIKAHEHRDNSETYCVECGINFSTKATYWAHINKTLKHASADDFKYKCSHCDKRFALQNVMQSHVQAMHEMSAEYYCEPCDKRYYSKSGLIRHKDNVHKGRVPPRNKVCDVCQKAFTSNALLKQHRNTHFGIRQFECSMCPAAYVAHGALYNHIQNVHKHRKKVKPEDRVLKVHSKRWTLKCPHCEEYLRGTKLLESHISIIHKKSADYECQYCSKRFYGEVSLQYHEDRHKGNIGRPRRKPEPVRNKICDVCGKAFFTNAVLNQHKNIHSGLRPFACTSCPKTFNASGALYMHVAVVHEKVKTWRKRPRTAKGTSAVPEGLDNQ